MRFIVTTLIVLAIGIGLGSFSAWYTIERGFDVSAIRSGPWRAYAFISGADVDPYTMAQSARTGIIPLGATEGLAFEAQQDSAREVLRLNCDYTVAGATPPSRLWTLAAYRPDGQLLTREDGEAVGIHSGRIVRFSDGSFSVTLSQRPRSGNWVELSGDGNFALTLRVYDTPVTSTTGVVTPVMPRITRGECN